MTITKEDFEGLRLGLAKIQGGPTLKTDLTEEELELLDKAKSQGYLTLDYKKARDHLYLIMLWEVYCASERKPTFWVLKRATEAESLLCVNVHTTGRTLGLKGWTSLLQATTGMGLALENKAVAGIRVYKGALPANWRETLTSTIEKSLWGVPRDRLNYKVSWSSWGIFWKTGGKEENDEWNGCGPYQRVPGSHERGTG